VTGSVWFDKSDAERPWRIRYANGVDARAEYVELADAATRLKADGFMELPGGPRGIIEGEITSTVGEVPA